MQTAQKERMRKLGSTLVDRTTSSRSQRFQSRLQRTYQSSEQIKNKIKIYLL